LELQVPQVQVERVLRQQPVELVELMEQLELMVETLLLDLLLYLKELRLEL
jgi:hypothetical protein